MSQLSFDFVNQTMFDDSTQMTIVEVLRDLQTAVYASAKEKGWWPEIEPEGNRKYVPNIPEKLALVHSEISEALEAFREVQFESDLRRVGFEGLKPVGFATELADAVIRILDLCAYLDIDLGAVILEKMAYNRTRPHRHGGKRC